MEDDLAYELVVVVDDVATTYRSGLSHAAAMRLAEELREEEPGNMVRVMHVVGVGRCEVDRYPLR